MFDAIDPGRKISNKEYEERVPALREQLLAAQFALATSERSVIIVIAGIEGAGKGALVHRLNEWMDPRRIETNTYWMRSDEEESRPYYWRFWRNMPKRGRIGIFLGSWYRGPVQRTIDADLSGEQFLEHCDQIRLFEDMLAADGTLVFKLWLHIDEKTQAGQLAERAGADQNPRVTDVPYELHGQYNKQVKVASKLLESTSTRSNPWHIIDASERNYRELRAGELLVTAMMRRLSGMDDEETAGTNGAEETQDQPVQAAGTRLRDLDLSASMERKAYKTQLKKQQGKLEELAWKAFGERRPVVAIFEGWDAAGKGSSIRRVTGAIDPRLYSLHQYAAPTEEERAQHYLWRFWRRLGRDGRCTFFDRSWYGRVLVERVEGFATDTEWQRAYTEINDFEQQLASHGAILLKFWLHISKDEQLHRFEEREADPRKRYKITEEDWRNREKWDEYEAAVEDMLTHTDTDYAPWSVIAGNDKRHARIDVLKTFCKRIEKALDGK